MSSEHYRRHTDRGYIVQFPATLAVIRRVLGLVPVTESLRDLGHWRRSPAATQATAGD